MFLRIMSGRYAPVPQARSCIISADPIRNTPSDGPAALLALSVTNPCGCWDAHGARCSKPCDLFRQHAAALQGGFPPTRDMPGSSVPAERRWDLQLSQVIV